MTPNIAIVLSHLTAASVAYPSWSTSLGTLVDKLDNAIRFQFQESSEEMFDWVIRSTMVLAVGCILELPEILFDIWPKWFFCLTGTSKLRHKRVENIFKKIGLARWVLVAAGIIGEGIFETLQNRVDGQLQTFNDILLTDARLTADNARSSAIDAEASAQRTRKIADGAVSTAGNAIAKADEARGKLEQVVNEAKQIETNLDKTRDSLSVRQIKDFKPLQEVFDGMKLQPITIQSYAGDPEAFGICNFLVSLAKRLNPDNQCWAVSPSRGSTSLISGIAIFGPDEEVKRQIAFAANQAGIKDGSGTYLYPDAPMLTIFVGIRQPFRTEQANPNKK